MNHSANTNILIATMGWPHVQAQHTVRHSNENSDQHHIHNHTLAEQEAKERLSL